MLPGIYRNLSNDSYHAGPGDSKSGLDLVRKSPVRLLKAKTASREERRKPTPSQALGTALHCLVLEPDTYGERYAMPFEAPEGALGTIDQLKAALDAGGVAYTSKLKKPDLEQLARDTLADAVILSDALAAYTAENEGKEILSPDIDAQLRNMAAAVWAHPAARKLLSAPGEAELSAYWLHQVTDPATGEPIGEPLLLRARPDYWRRDGILVDLKSCQPGGAAPEEFARSIAGWRYFVQHPFYLGGTAAALASENAKAREHEDLPASFAEYATPRDFVFIAVENDACVVDGVAMGVAVYQLQPDSVELGRLEYTEDLASLASCYAGERWPGYSDRVEAIQLPAWQFTKAAARIASA